MDQAEKEHKVEIISRKKLIVVGVSEVISSQDGVVSLKTNNGNMQIAGSTLRIGKLDLEKGLLEVDGTINGVKYLGGIEKKSFFARLFK